MTVYKTGEPKLIWKSWDEKGGTWFETSLSAPDLNPQELPAESSERTVLIKILQEAQKLNPKFMRDGSGYRIETRLTFPRDWGLGTSSTLINNIAQWAQVDAFQLLWNSFGGSGYDIACAQNNGALLYQLKEGRPHIQKTVFDPPFKDALYFVYLNKKQSSKEGISNYGKRIFDREKLVASISQITLEVARCQKQHEFEKLIGEHEGLLSQALENPTIKAALFPDYFGAVKSLGAWGGDFALVTGNHKSPDYFKEKGYETVIPFSQMIL